MGQGRGRASAQNLANSSGSVQSICSQRMSPPIDERSMGVMLGPWTRLGRRYPKGGREPGASSPAPAFGVDCHCPFSQLGTRAPAGRGARITERVLVFETHQLVDVVDSAGAFESLQRRVHRAGGADSAILSP